VPPPYQVIPFSQASAIITDSPPASSVVEELHARRVEVITAEQHDARSAIG
jgi:DeoR/GlpR family transcriptional regulator of sugar metabolism